MEKILPPSAPQTCRGSTSGPEDSRVRTFLYLADKEGLQENEALSFLKSLDCSKARQLKIDPNGLSLKMLKICSPLIEAGTLRPFSVRWPKSAIISSTDCLIHDSTAYRKTESGYTLSLIDILEPEVDEKYFLSPQATAADLPEERECILSTFAKAIQELPRTPAV